MEGTSSRGEAFPSNASPLKGRMSVHLKKVIFVIGLILWAEPMLYGAGHLSGSKLGIHLIGRYTPAARKIVAAGPRVIKVLDLVSQ